MISVDNHVASHAGARQVADAEDRNDTMRPLRAAYSDGFGSKSLSPWSSAFWSGSSFPTRGRRSNLGDGFVMLIRIALAPIIFGIMVIGIARMGDLREVGRVGAKALLYFEVVSTVDLIMGLVDVDILQPGRGMNVNPATLDAKAVAGYASTAEKGLRLPPSAALAAD